MMLPTQNSRIWHLHFASRITIPLRQRPNTSARGRRAKLPSSNLASPEHCAFIKNQCEKKKNAVLQKESGTTKRSARKGKQSFRQETEENQLWRRRSRNRKGSRLMRMTNLWRDVQ